MGYAGANCERRTCGGDEGVKCKNGGRCDEKSGTCACAKGFAGDDCGRDMCEGCEAHKGICVGDRCYCLPGWTGTACDTETCPKPCEKSQVCERGTCVSPEKAAEARAKVMSDHKRNALRAQSAASSDEETSYAQDLHCPFGSSRDEVCSGRGKCVGGICFCEQGRGGTDCRLRVCPGNPQCGGHGTCYMGQCICDDGFHGTLCGVEREDDRGNDDDEASKGALLLKWERERTQIVRKLKRVRSDLAKRVENADGSDDDAMADAIRKLRDEAMELADRSDAVSKKIDASRVESGPAPSTTVKAKAESAQTTAMAKQLAFELFGNDKRQEVALALARNDTIDAESFAGVVDTHLAAMWADLPSQYRDEYVKAARAALVVKESTWSVAKRLFLDSTGGPSGSSEIEAAWDALPPATKARFFISAQALVHGDHAASGSKSVHDAVESLQKNVNDLAFDLFSDEKYRWASDQVVASSAASAFSPTSRSAAYPDVQHLLAKTYQSLSTSARRRYVKRAEQLLSSSFFANPQPLANAGADDVASPGTSLSIPLHRTLVTFTVQFLGLTNADMSDRQTRGVVDQAVEAMLRADLRRQVRLVQQDDDATVVTTNAFRRRYIVSVVNSASKLINKVLNTIRAGVNQGDLAQRLRDEGVSATPVFVLGAEPQLLTENGATQYTCKDESDCSFRGTCEDGHCACRVEARNGTLLEFSGYDCSFGPTVVCMDDCSFKGVCQQNGTCLCAPGHGGASCDVETCPNDCSDHGVCFEGQCACESGWTGPACATKAKRRACEDGCHGHGHCTKSGDCACDGHYVGPTCERLQVPCSPRCGTHGTCHNGTCACETAWKGETCETKTCPDKCSGHGRCEADGEPHAACACDKGWTGDACSCPASSNGEECSGHGSCHEGECYCHHAWGGEACDLKMCTPPDCSGHGSCKQGTCECVEGWKGSGCGVKTCPAACDASPHGTCDGATCVCKDGWTGESCEANAAKFCEDDCHATDAQGECVAVKGEEPLAVCACRDGFGGPRCEYKMCSTHSLNDCSGHGLCVMDDFEVSDNTMDRRCVCEPGWSGDSCDTWTCEDAASCSGHGTCVDGGSDSKTCQCSVDWTGPKCEFQSGVEACAVCCMGECLDSCDKEHETDLDIVKCYPNCQSECVGRCQTGEDEKCPQNRERYAHLLDALDEEDETRR